MAEPRGGEVEKLVPSHNCSPSTASFWETPAMNQKFCDSVTIEVRFLYYFQPRHFNLKNLLYKESYTYLKLLTDNLDSEFGFHNGISKKPQTADNTHKTYVERK